MQPVRDVPKAQVTWEARLPLLQHPRRGPAVGSHFRLSPLKPPSLLASPLASRLLCAASPLDAPYFLGLPPELASCALSGTRSPPLSPPSFPLLCTCLLLPRLIPRFPTFCAAPLCLEPRPLSSLAPRALKLRPFISPLSILRQLASPNLHASCAPSRPHTTLPHLLSCSIFASGCASPWASPLALAPHPCVFAFAFALHPYPAPPPLAACASSRPRHPQACHLCADRWHQVPLHTPHQVPPAHRHPPPPHVGCTGQPP